MALERPIRVLDDGTFRLELGEGARKMLAVNAPQLRELVATSPDDARLRRLFPTARPDDAEADQAYQDMVRDELQATRLARLDALGALTQDQRLDREQLHEFMGAVNDLRLVLGTSLDVSENDAAINPAEAELPEAVARSVYQYLGWLLEHLVEAASGEL